MMRTALSHDQRTRWQRGRREQLKTANLRLHRLIRGITMGLMTAAALLAGAVSLPAHAQGHAQGHAQAQTAIRLPSPDVATSDYGLKASPLTGGWYVIAGANDDFSVANGCNIINTVFVADGDGALEVGARGASGGRRR